MANLILTNPTTGERTQAWKGTHQLWGTALTLEGYLEREQRQLDIPLAKDGGLTNWILTEKEGKPDERPVLSSCETLKKRCLVRQADGTIKEGWAHGVASVFTDPQFRRKGYAKTMMAQLAEHFRQLEKGRPGAAVASILYSDVGKEFYAVNGWEPFASDHVEWPASATAPSTSHNLKLISFEDIPSVVEKDEAILYKALTSAPSAGDKPVRVAILPSLDQFHWHILRERFVSENLFSKHPTVHGATYRPSPSGPSVSALWARSFSGTAAQPEKNTLYILRLVVEEGLSDEGLKEALAGIVDAARAQAAEWKCGKVEMWNPEERVKKIAEAVRGTWKRRETDSITSLNWFAEGDKGDVEWLINEKYAWC